MSPKVGRTMLGAFGGADGGKDLLEGVALDERFAGVVVLFELTTFCRMESESVSGGAVRFVLEPDGSVELDRPDGLEVELDVVTATGAIFAAPLIESFVFDGATTGASGSPSRSITSSSSPACVTCLAPCAALNEKNDVQEALFSTESSSMGFRPEIADAISASRGVDSSGMTVDALVRGGEV